MTETRSAIYVGGFIVVPALALLLMITFMDFHMWLLLTIFILFGSGVVIVPAFLGGEEG